ncbi:splicing factor 3B subunit 2 [Trichonephila clavipes]|nr:splicing factor 3B subunit 2 [Trichonephila clavipes]
MEEVEVCLNPNLKASSNVIFVQHHWRKYSQVQRGVEKPTPKLPFIKRFGVMRRRPTMRKKVRLKSRMNDIDSPKLQNSVFKHLAKPKATIYGDLCVFKEKPVTCSQIMVQLPAERISEWGRVEIDFCEISGLNILIKEKEP